MIRINWDTLHAGVAENKSNINLYDLTLANSVRKIILAKYNLIKMFGKWFSLQIIMVLNDDKLAGSGWIIWG